METLLPLNKKVLIERDEAENVKGGIIIPDTAKEQMCSGRIVALPRNLLNGEREDVRLAVGEKVLFGKYSGHDVEMNGENFVLINIEELFGVLVDAN